jgi:hypothetical protein
MKQNFCLTVIVCTAIIIFVVSGCASVNKKSDPAAKDFNINITKPSDFTFPKGLEDEFKRYWIYRYTDRFKSAYSMETPQFRESITFDQYKNYIARTSNQKLIELELTQIYTYDSFKKNKISDIGVRFHLERDKGRVIQSYIEDTWIKIDGQWFHRLKNRLLFPGVKYE